MTLREEDGSQNGLNGADQFMQGESNFFLDEPPASNGLDLALKEGEGYDEVEAVNKKHQGEDETMEEGNEEEEEKEEIDPGKAQRMFDEIFDCSTLSKDELEQRKKRYQRECEMGYFLQPISVVKLKKKIYFYDDLVRQMETEFKQRIQEKRKTISRMKLKMKEHALTDALMICERCNQDIAPMRTFDFICNDLHYAKCVFGSLIRVELPEA